MSSLLLSLLLLYKVHASVRSRPHGKGATGFFSSGASLVDKEGRRPQLLPESAEELNDESVQGFAVPEIEGMQSIVSDSVGEEPLDVEEHDAGDYLEEQAERKLIEEMTENGQEEFSDSCREPGENEGSHKEFFIGHTKQEQDFNMEDMLLDQEKKPAEMREENVTGTSLQDTVLTPWPSQQDHGNLQALITEEGPGSHNSSGSMLTGEQGDDFGKDLRAVDSAGRHEGVANFEDTPWKDASDEIFELDTPHAHLGTEQHARQDPVLSSEKQSGSTTADFGLDEPGKYDLFSSELKDVQEGREAGCSSTDGFEPGRAEAFAKEQQDDALPHLSTEQHARQDPVLSSEKQSGSTTADFGLGKPEKYDLFSSEMKDVQEGREASCSSTDGFKPGRAEAFAKEQQDDALPQQGLLDSILLETSEQDHPFETSSIAAASTNRPLEDFQSQDKTQEQHAILADISSIKKIVGYQGEAHASAMEQIAALYQFLGMEPYDWDVGVDDLERARAEIELLKVVVGVK
ncbi:hypothetical protein L7F22_040585 [Adiantum nelumboides]|nr:hypothetical protein [Adiantum nelumboides]